MTRTVANVLVLVNWKGVFYARYELDRHVTALEGANGAGKTTVMIAAYVVLLPDMNRLRFTNLGETWATGGDKGIWGRLGEEGRPSYAAIEFTVEGSRRIIAGVHLTRKGEPSVEPTPFVVTGLGSDVRLQELMLVPQGDHEAVPELTELQENAARLGGRLRSFVSARDYFTWLFDEGVTPLKLGTDEERTKLNEMLRTSMAGGISRALTSELRSFLLKESGGLADTLQRMRANLDACRRTRTEVQESQRLEKEIGGVFEAGQAMFAAALHATRERAEELQRRVADAEENRQVATAALNDAEAALTRVQQELASVELRRVDTEAAHVKARDWLSRLQTALAAAADVARIRKELAEAETHESQAAFEKALAEQTLAVRRAERKRAQEHQQHAANGLSNLKQGVDQLHHRAGAHRQVVRKRQEVQELLGLAELRRDELAPRLDECRRRLVASDGERREGAMQLADASAHRSAYEGALNALRTLIGEAAAIASPHAVAIQALHRQSELRTLAERVSFIATELNSARTQAERQRALWRTAESLGLHPAQGSSSDRVRALLEGVEAEQRLHEEEARAARERLLATEHMLDQATSRRRELTEREPRWQELDVRARRLGRGISIDVVDRHTLDRARALVGEQLTVARAHEEALSHSREGLIAQARELLAAGGPFEPELLRLKDELAADLLAASFEDVGIEDARLLEARLGPLAQALTVEDPLAAAGVLANRAGTLSSVWLVARDVSASSLAVAGTHQAGAPVVLVEEGRALRVTRIPERPVLGRRAREKRAAELREEAEQENRRFEETRTRRLTLERLKEDGEAILTGQADWLAGDPSAELTELQGRIIEMEAHVANDGRTAAQCAESARALQPRIRGLRDLLGEAYLLDPPDHGARVTQLEEEQKAAIAARSEVTRCAEATRTVEAMLHVLRVPPLSEADLDVLRQRVDALRQERARLDSAIESLEFVVGNVEALAWNDAEQSLRREEALVPALKEQLRLAGDQLESADEALEIAEKVREDRYREWQEAESRRSASHHQLIVSEKRFRDLDISEPSAAAERDAGAAVQRLGNEVSALAKDFSELATEKGRREKTCDQKRRETQEAEAKALSERREAAPAMERWERLRARAAQHQLLAGALVPGGSNVSSIRGHVNLVLEAHKQRRVLDERLGNARDGQGLLNREVRDADASELAFADTYLELWLAVRDWLRRRLPAQIAEIDDPREALARLREQLATLEERLNRQENDLRGASEDVARGIDVQIRKARGQVQRLNTHLTGVSFGSVQGIRVRIQHDEQMEQVLRALRDGAAQGLLFQQSLPIEDALDEIFRRYGGGRSGGQRLLDYREYVHLQVETRRHSRTDWEGASPTRLSTGEAIGVGAALMMVVLTEWEHDANLLRGKRSSGSLRFLFLDEANRLSQDNLGVLFELCQTLELQLLIAAPEVAHAEGNTTYRLVRRVEGEGREEVVVSGRRVRADA